MSTTASYKNSRRQMIVAYSIRQNIISRRQTRRHVECAFGIMCNKWRLLHRSIDLDLQFSKIVIRACIILHNFVRQIDGKSQEDETIEECTLQKVTRARIHVPVSKNGIDVRDKYARYFTSPAGVVSWQYDKVVWSAVCWHDILTNAMWSIDYSLPF